MTSEALLRAIGNISDDLLEGAEEPPVRRVNQWVRWGAMAAALVIVAGLAMAIPKLSQHMGNETTMAAEESTAITEGAVETPAAAEETEPAAEMEMPMEPVMPEESDEYSTERESPASESEEATDSNNAFQPDRRNVLNLIHADSIGLSPHLIEGDTTVAAMPGTLIDLPLSRTAGRYYYGDDQIVVDVTETVLTTLEEGYMSDFVTDGEWMYLTPDNVSYIDGHAVCIAKTPDGFAAETLVINDDAQLIVTFRFSRDIGIEDVISAITELCSVIQ